MFSSLQGDLVTFVIVDSVAVLAENISIGISNNLLNKVAEL